MTTYSSREEIPEQYRWDLTSVYENDEAFLAALEKAKELPPKFASFQGKISQSAADLLAYLRFDDEADLVLTKLVNYAERKSDEDTRESRYQDYSSQVMTLWVAISSAASWFTSELLSLSEAQMEAFYAEEPALEQYRRCLDVIFAKREHVLTPAEEKLLAAAGDMASQPDTPSRCSTMPLTFPDAIDAEGNAHPVTHGSYIPLMMSTDRTLRESAYHSLYSSYRQFRNTFAATLGAQNKQLKFFADARHYNSALEAALPATKCPRRCTPTSSKPCTTTWTPCTATWHCAKSCWASTSCAFPICTCPWRR